MKTPEEFLKDKNIPEKRDRQIIEKWCAEYAEYYHAQFASRPSDVSDEKLKNHFNDSETYQMFINNLSDMISHLSFEGRRKMIEAKKTTASMVLRFEEYGKLPKNEAYYLSLNKVGNVVLDGHIKPTIEGDKPSSDILLDNKEYD